MTRTIVLVSVLFGACTVGEVPIGGGGGGDDDGGGGGGDGGGSNNLACVDRSATPATAHAHDGDPADTRAGQACVVGGCHAPDTAQPFGAAGTVYQADGVTPSAGVTVRIFPPNATTPLTALTDTAGNFNFSAIQISDASFPASTQATVCPSTKPMTAKLLTGPLAGGNCNNAGCHEAGGATGVIKE